jgi:hypothetical protein
MKSSMMAVTVAAAAATLAGCTTFDSSRFASRDKTVEYIRVFDIKTEAGANLVARAASEGISRNVSNATLATPLPATSAVAEQPGRLKLADPAASPPGAPVPSGPSCEGAAWTAKAAPEVRGGQNMNMVACLFPYKNGYHLDMYAVFTKKEGGWLEWPRRMTGAVMGTPEKWTEATMLDIVRAIRESTNAQVALVEAKPDLNGAPWLEPGKGTSAAPATDTTSKSQP